MLGFDSLSLASTVKLSSEPFIDKIWEEIKPLKPDKSEVSIPCSACFEKSESTFGPSQNGIFNSKILRFTRHSVKVQHHNHSSLIKDSNDLIMYKDPSFATKHFRTKRSPNIKRSNSVRQCINFRAFSPAMSRESLRRPLSSGALYRSYSAPISNEPSTDSDLSLVPLQQSGVQQGSRENDISFASLQIPKWSSSSTNVHKWRGFFDPLCSPAENFEFNLPVPEAFMNVDFTQLALMNGLDWRGLRLTDMKKLSESQCAPFLFECCN